MQTYISDEQAKDNAFRDYIGFGHITLPVLYRGRVWQMCRIGSDFVFARIEGYDGEDIHVIPGLSDRVAAYADERKHFSLPQSAVVKAEITGKYLDYFTLGGVTLRLTAKKGRQEKILFLRIFGGINEFVLRGFLEGIDGEITVTKDTAATSYAAVEPLARTSMMRHFNRIALRLKRLMRLLSILSCLLLIADYLITDFPWLAPYAKFMTGIGALGPFAIFLLYLGHSRLVSFLAPDTPRNAPGVTRTYVSFYAAFGIPMGVEMFAAIGGRTVITDLPRLLIMGLGLAAVMFVLMLLFTHEYRYKYMILAGAAVLLIAYPFPTVHLINRMAVTEEYALHTATVEEKRVNPQSEYDEATYMGVTLSNGRDQELPPYLEGESAVTVHEYRGLLGIDCADVAPV